MHSLSVLQSRSVEHKTGAISSGAQVSAEDTSPIPISVVGKALTSCVDDSVVSSAHAPDRAKAIIHRRMKTCFITCSGKSEDAVSYLECN